MQDIYELVSKWAYKNTLPFCYSCYQRAENGRCMGCGSDDLMRELPGIGVDWGIGWAIPHLLREHLNPVDMEDVFSEVISDAYGDSVKIAWFSVETVSAIKALDPLAWELALSEHIDFEVSEGNLVSFDQIHYYRCDDIEELIAAQLEPE